MKTCEYCELPLPLPDNFDGVYCDRNCFEAHIATALKTDSAHCLDDLSKYFDQESILLTNVKRKGCKIRQRICELRDDAEQRVANIDTYNTNKLMLTRAYFKSRADVLNDLLMLMTPSDKPCSCC